MDTIIIGGDDRFAQLARLLVGRGERVGVLGRENAPGTRAASREDLRAARRVVTNWPPREVSREDIYAAISGGARAFLCGPGHPEQKREGVVDLWGDEALLIENARLTAEGAVSAAMRASSACLWEMRCLVVGWGRIGRALTEILVALGARVTVASRRAEGRNRAVERGAEAVDTLDLAAALPGQKLVLNTAPGTVLDASALVRADGDAMLIDLASPPYGIDLLAAWSLGLRAWREPGMPGRYCPRSAAEALLRAMDRHMETEAYPHE